MEKGKRLIMKEFWNKYKKKILEILIIVGVLILISFVSMILLRAFGVIYYDDGMKINTELFDSFKNSWYGSIIIILIQVIITNLLCFIPGASMAFILLLQTLYSNPWQAFFIAFLGVLISSTMMYLIGRIGGYRVCAKILGDKDCEKASELLNDKGVIYFPIMMLFPLFPDDALVMIAGTLKMSLKWFIPSNVIGRGVGVATIVFGLASIPYDKFTTPWHWIGFVLICAILIITVFYLAHRLNVYLSKRKNVEE